MICVEKADTPLMKIRSLFVTSFFLSLSFSSILWGETSPLMMFQEGETSEHENASETSERQQKERQLTENGESSSCLIPRGTLVGASEKIIPQEKTPPSCSTLSTSLNFDINQQARLTDAELSQAQREDARILAKINEAKANEIDANNYYRIVNLFDDRENKLAKLCQRIDETLIDAEASKLQEWRDRSIFWKIVFLKNQALRKEFLSKTARDRFFKFVNNRAIDTAEVRDSKSAISFLKEAIANMEKEKAAWSRLEWACVELQKNASDKIADYLTEELSMTREEIVFLEAQQKECEWRKKNIHAEVTCYGALQIQDRKDPLYKKKRLEAETAADIRKEMWNDLKKFYRKNAPQSKFHKEKWNTLYSTLQKEIMVSEWKYHDFKKEDAIKSVEQYIEYYANCTPALTFYSALIEQGKEVVTHCENLSHFFECCLNNFSDVFEKNNEAPLSRMWWQKNQNEIEELKQSWIADLAIWKQKEKDLKKRAKGTFFNF